MNPFLMEQLLDQKRQEMLKEAERIQLVKEFEATTAGRWEIIGVFIGNFLINLGQRIKNRSEPVGELGVGLKTS